MQVEDKKRRNSSAIPRLFDKKLRKNIRFGGCGGPQNTLPRKDAMELTKTELDARRERFCAAMDASHPNWDTALVIDKVNQYYFMGTMQDGVLFIRRDRSYVYYVRRSFRRATLESPLKHIHEMRTYRDAAQREGGGLGHTFLESETLTIHVLHMLRKYFQMQSTGPLDPVIRRVRAVKSPYELNLMTQAGRLHHKLTVEDIPALLREGISEAAFAAAIYGVMVSHGHQFITRFHKFQTEMGVGQIGFGENTLFPTSFDGPGGSHGYGAASHIGGDPARMLKKGDLVFVDTGLGLHGYHSDKTQVFFFGAQPPEEAVRVHCGCMEVEQEIARQLKPGAIPSQIYKDVLAGMDDGLRRGFGGYGGQYVHFFGHGVGLQIDEYPVIARGFDDPLEENMVISLEPKKGLAGIGTVGVEDMYVVTPEGGKCLTSGPRDIMVIPAG